MEDLYDPEEKILCPYNSAHHIRRCKMSFHLVKCKKNYGEQKMVPCDFNATHVVPEPELRFHHQNCEDRKKIEAQIVESQKKTESRYPIAVLDCPPEESWDYDNAPTYDPKKYTETHDVLRQLSVESGAKRKNFRLNERQRFNNLSQQNIVSPPARKPETRRLPMHHRVARVEEERDRSDPESFRQVVRSRRMYEQRSESDITN